jgi:hypothetical protein
MKSRGTKNLDWENPWPDGTPNISATSFQLQTSEVATRLGYPCRCMSLAHEPLVLEIGGSLESLVTGHCARHCGG